MFDDILAYILPALSVGTVLGAVFTVVLTFFILSLPLRLLIVYSNNYKVAIFCRKLADWLLLFILAVVVLQSLSASIQASLYLLSDENVFIGMMERVIAALMTLPPFYLIVKHMVNKVEFYEAKHQKYLEYFILYLRSFKDDKKTKSEKKLMKALKRLYYPFAIGRPNEFMPQQGAKRIYVGEDWRQVVIELQKKAPLILQRVNTSENFLWEFDQCVQGGHLPKVLFWVADYLEYAQFRELIASKYGLVFPELDARMKCEQVFYYLPDGSFRIYALKDDQAYHDLAKSYLKDHPMHKEQYKDYLYGRSWWKQLGLAFRTTYDKHIMPGVNRWSWIGFLCADFYLICQPIKWRILWYGILMTMPLLCIHANVSWWYMSIMYGLLSLVMGKNGRTLVWVSQKWESVALFNKSVHSRNILVVILGIGRVLIGVGIWFFLLFNPFGWDLPHFPFAFW